MTTDTFTNRLVKELKAIESKMMELLDASSIKSNPRDPNPAVWICPHEWGDTDERQRLLQMQIKEKYLLWLEKFRLLYRHAPEETLSKIFDADKFITDWVEKKAVGWTLTASAIPEAKIMFSQEIKILFDLLTIHHGSDIGEPVLILDTSALMDAPDPAKYAGVAGGSKYTLVILPTVLEELEKHKLGRDEVRRDLAKGVLNRLKGWRQQGQLTEGVTANRTVTIKIEHKEPDFENTLHWLDSSVKDDRIIASALEIQIAHPARSVTLITSDFNLQTKAAAASLQFAEPAN